MQQSAGQAFILPKTSPYIDELSKATLELINQQQIETPDEFYERRGLCHVPDGQSGVSMRRLWSFFTCAYGICFVMFVVLVFNQWSGSLDGEQDDEEAGNASKNHDLVESQVDPTK